MQTTIIIATHKPYWIPEDSMYLPVQMGHAIHPDIGYVGDDTGENISEKNASFCELTGLYWLWKNRKFDGNIGVCHYRRFFVNDKRELLSEKDYDQILSDYDLFWA